jgi:hypothetical protein
VIRHRLLVLEVDRLLGVVETGDDERVKKAQLSRVDSEYGKRLYSTAGDNRTVRASLENDECPTDSCPPQPQCSPRLHSSRALALYPRVTLLIVRESLTSKLLSE